MKKLAPGLVTALALFWSGLAAPGPTADPLDQELLVGLTFGAPQPSSLSLSYRVDQPPGVRRALTWFGVTSGPASPGPTDDPGHLWLPPLVQWDWQSRKGCEVRVNGLSLLSRDSGRANADDAPAGDTASQSGLSLTTKLLIGGAAVVAIAAAASAGGGHGYGGGGGGYNGSCATCNSDAAHKCDGQVSGICNGGRLDDDGDCSTTCDTL